MQWLAATRLFFSSLTPFQWTLIVAAIAFLILLILTFRSRKPLRIPKLKSKSGSEKKQYQNILGLIRAWLRQFFSDLKTLFSQSEDYYQTPWVLMIGDQGAGKSSLGASLVSSPRLQCLVSDPLHDPDKQGWWKFDKGMLVDVDSLIQQTSEKDFVAQLMKVRAERPLDGALLCISATELLHSSEREILDKGLALHKQLSRFQQQFNFTFPVYVLVTKADQIEGFKEFCETRSADELQQIFGWSNPSSLESGYNPDWVMEALDSLRSTLRDIQLEVASEGEDSISGDKDAFYLFPRRLEVISRPLGKLLTQIFTVNAYQANFFFRGIYFSGISRRETSAEQSPAPDVAFLDQLFSEKVFSEHHLARPIKDSIWSRQLQIRRLQKTLVSCFAVLLVGLTIASLSLNRKVEEITDIMTLIDFERRNSNTAEVGCTDYATLEKLLVYMSSVDSGLASFFMPISWVDRRNQDLVAETASEGTLRDVVFRAFDCKIKNIETQLVSVQPPAYQKTEIIDSLTGLVDYLEDYLKEVIELNKVVSSWKSFSDSGSLEGTQRLEDLDAVLRTLYGSGLPQQVQRKRTAVMDILAYADVKPYEISADTHSAIEANVDQLLSLINDRALEGLKVGSTLSPKLDSGEASVSDIRRFVHWLDWVTEDWLLSGGGTSVCEDMAQQIAGELTTLDQLSVYSGFAADALANFESVNCQDLVQSNLADMRIAPLANMVLVSPSSSAAQPEYLLSATWKKERDYLEQLSRQSFMQLESSGGFVCDAGATLWDRDTLAEANTHMQEFAEFLASTELDSAQDRDTTRLDSAANMADWPHARLGRTSLLKVLDQLLTAAQQDLSRSNNSSLNSSANAQVRVRQASVNFDGSLTELQDLFKLYANLNMQSAAQPLATCVQQFAGRQLTAVGALADSSSLMQPVESSDAQIAAGAPVFMFGSELAPDNWWKNEMARAEVVLSYAKPYVSLLNATKADYGGLGQQAQLAQYWGNSLSELQNTLEFGRTDGQISDLNGFFSAVAGMTEANCSAAMQSLPESVPGIDFFSVRRQFNQAQFSDHCSDSLSSTGSSLYTGLQNDFSFIQGRFPFASKDITREADLVRTRSFFMEYAADAADLRSYLLAQATDKKAVASQLDQFDGAVQFFNSHLAVEGPPVRLNMDVQFRSTESSGSANLSSWRIGNGIEWIYRPARPSMTLSWYYGEPLQVVFNWPDQLRPLADAAQPNLRIDASKNQASFYFGGSFALQRLIANHLESGPAVGDRAAKPIGLRFVVPVAVASSATASGSTESKTGVESTAVELFIEINLSTTDASGKPVPVFVPTVLPSLFPSSK